MAPRQVHVSLTVGEMRVHRFQVVREHRAEGSHEDWIVVDFPPEGVALASLDFDWSRTVPVSSVEDGAFEPLYADDVPVWGY